MFIYGLSIFLTTTDLIKDTKAIIIFLSNSQVLLTNRQKCGKIYSSHELNIFIPKTGKYFGKKCFLSFLIPLLGSNSCDNNCGGSIFSVRSFWGALFIC